MLHHSSITFLSREVWRLECNLRCIVRIIALKQLVIDDAKLVRVVSIVAILIERGRVLMSMMVLMIFLFKVVTVVLFDILCRIFLTISDEILDDHLALRTILADVLI